MHREVVDCIRWMHAGTWRIHAWSAMTAVWTTRMTMQLPQVYITSSRKCCPPQARRNQEGGVQQQTMQRTAGAGTGAVRRQKRRGKRLVIDGTGPCTATVHRLCHAILTRRPGRPQLLIWHPASESEHNSALLRRQGDALPLPMACAHLVYSRRSHSARFSVYRIAFKQLVGHISSALRRGWASVSIYSGARRAAGTPSVTWAP